MSHTNGYGDVTVTPGLFNAPLNLNPVDSGAVGLRAAFK